MKRRDFLFAAAFVVPASQAMAEQCSTLKRVAMVHPATKPGDMRIGGDPNYAIVFEEMQRLGYVEGVNMIVDRYSAEGRFGHYVSIIGHKEPLAHKGQSFCGAQFSGLRPR